MSNLTSLYENPKYVDELKEGDVLIILEMFPEEETSLLQDCVPGQKCVVTQGLVDSSCGSLEDSYCKQYCCSGYRYFRVKTEVNGRDKIYASCYFRFGDKYGRQLLVRGVE